MYQETCVIILCLSNIFGERWYSASIAENENDPAISSDFSQYADKFKHLPTYSNEKPVRHRWHFEKAEATLVKSPNTTTEIHQKGEVYNHHPDLQAVEVLERNMTSSYLKRPAMLTKRKILRKRCPNLPRKSRVLMSGNGGKGRFLELFQVVEFDRVTCSSPSGLEGVCLHEYDCEISGGTGMGTCADGFGTCCINLRALSPSLSNHYQVIYLDHISPDGYLFKIGCLAMLPLLPCDTHTSAQTGWFTNPGFPAPSAERLSCTLTLNKTSQDIVQIRLDLNTFELLPPTAGSCESDQFVVSGQNINNIIPILCGVNNGQHIYIEVGDVKGSITLAIQTVSAVNRLYAVKVSQLTAYDQLSAPTGCLQYYREPQGYLESFNYDIKSNINIAKIPSYMNNMNYAICIERDPKTCSTTYTNTESMQIVNYDEEGVPVIPADQAGVEVFNCPDDWLLIAATRLCGDRLNDGSVIQDFAYDAPVTDTASGPIVVWFRTDGGYVGRGFKLEYQQNNCTNV